MKKFLTPRVIILAVVLIIALVAISPRFGADGVAIQFVDQNSPAGFAGITGPSPNAAPTSLERVIEVDSVDITSVEQFYEITAAAGVNETLILRTNEQTYVLSTEVINGTNITDNLGIFVSDPSNTNLRKGLDLQGGTRVLLRPETPLTEVEFETLRSIMEQRLNVYGISDVTVRIVRNLPAALGGVPEFVMVEIAGANIAQISDLLASQGKFEATINNVTVFSGDNDDIAYVDKTASGSGIQQCGNQGGQWFCQFFFAIRLSQDAADRMADQTRTQGIVGDSLEYPLDLFLDDSLVTSLQIAADLRGRSVTDIQISGSGTGASEQDARDAAIEELKQLQAVLETGSLPAKLVVEKADTVSPVLGSAFVRNAIVAGLLAMIGVAGMIFLRYRDWRIVIPTQITIFSEVIIVLGVAAMIGWNLDLAAIAGIIIVIGSSVDHQIVIIDEMRGKSSAKNNLKKAFGIIMGAYTTTLVAMLPLMFAGAGLLKGFALTTIIGVTVGVLITRPAFGSIMEKMYS